MSPSPLPHVEDDGGRADSGYQGQAGDCAARAFAIAGGIDYQLSYEFMAAVNHHNGGARSARNGIHVRDLRPILDDWFEWVTCKRVGDPNTVHMAKGELPPSGRLILRLSRHYSAVVDGVCRDTYDPGREGTRMVYAYWRVPTAMAGDELARLVAAETVRLNGAPRKVDRSGTRG